MNNEPWYIYDRLENYVSGMDNVERPSIWKTPCSGTTPHNPIPMCVGFISVSLAYFYANICLFLALPLAAPLLCGSSLCLLMASAFGCFFCCGVSDLWGLGSQIFEVCGPCGQTLCSTCFGRAFGFGFVSLEDRFSLELWCYYRMFTGVLCKSSTGG